MDAEFKILKIGSLKYDNIKSMSILREELNSFGYDYSIFEVKELFYSLLNNKLQEEFNLKFKYCFDCIFDNNEYERLEESNDM